MTARMDERIKGVNEEKEREKEPVRHAVEDADVILTEPQRESVSE